MWVALFEIGRVFAIPAFLLAAFVGLIVLLWKGITGRRQLFRRRQEPWLRCPVCNGTADDCNWPDNKQPYSVESPMPCRRISFEQHLRNLSENSQ